MIDSLILCSFLFFFAINTSNQEYFSKCLKKRKGSAVIGVVDKENCHGRDWYSKDCNNDG